MNILLFVVLVALFVVLSPGIFICLTPKAGKKVAALAHGVVFAVIWTIIYAALSRAGLAHGKLFFEGLTEKAKKAN